MKKFIDITTIKFLVVGVVNTLVGTSVMFIFYNVLGTGYWTASAANYIVGSIVSYFLNKYFTFKSKKQSLREILRFIVNIMLCYLLAYGIAKPFALNILQGQTKNIQENVAMLIGMCLFVGLNYLGQRFVVFKADVNE
ncbi:MAG: GtrA family protein [Bariatricus sp.]|nr:GtrA family protein [Bariatricus sp.]